MTIAHFGSFNAKGLRLTIDAFTRGPLIIDHVVERPVTIEQDAHQSALFPIGIFDTALGFAELLMLTGLAGAQGKEERTAIALGAVAMGMLERVAGRHTQTACAHGHAIGIKGRLGDLT